MRRITKIINLIVVAMLIVPRSSAIASYLASRPALIFQLEDLGAAVADQTSAEAKRLAVAA